MGMYQRCGDAARMSRGSTGFVVGWMIRFYFVCIAEPLPVLAKTGALRATGAKSRNARGVPTLANSRRSDPVPAGARAPAPGLPRRTAAGRSAAIQIRKAGRGEWKKNPRPCAESADSFTKPYKPLSGTGRKPPFLSHEKPRKRPKVRVSCRKLYIFRPFPERPLGKGHGSLPAEVALRPPSSVPFGYPRLLAGYAPPGVQRPGEGPTQCGLCTPGILMTLTADLRHNPPPAQQQVRDMLAGNLCRCTGYQGMVDAVKAFVESSQPDGGAAWSGI